MKTLHDGAATGDLLRNDLTPLHGFHQTAMTLLGTGRQAPTYAWDEGRVAKALRSRTGLELVE